MPDKSPSLIQLTAYSVPGFAFMAVNVPVVVILPTLYGKHTAVDVATIGTIFIVMRIFDAVTDPLIGYLSDRTRTRLGARKPWVIAGSILTMVAVYFLFKIPPQADGYYFGIWALLFYLGMTMYHIPHMAWGSELTTDYSQRARVFSIRGILETCGNLSYTLLPILLFSFGIIATTEFSPYVIGILGYIAVILIPLSSVIAVLVAPAGNRLTGKRPTLKGVYTAAVYNRPLLRFLTAYVLGGAGTGVFAALIFPYLDGHLKIGDKLPHILLIAGIATLISLLIWPKVVNLIGKHRTWACGWSVNALAMLMLGFIQPGENAVVLVICCFVIYGFMGGASLVAPFALLADIVDYDILKTHVDRAGNYYSFIFFIAKVTASVGGLALILLGSVFGYEIKEGAVNSGYAISGLILLACVTPALLQAAALPFIWNFPIDQRRHSIIRRRIAQRNSRQTGKAAV